MKNIFILVPSICDDSPIQGAAALSNVLSKSAKVTFVSLRGGVSDVELLNQRVNSISLKDYSWFKKIKIFKKILLKHGGKENTLVVSFCFMADFVNSFCTKNTTTFASIRANLPLDYSNLYGVFGLILAKLHYRRLKKISHIISMTEAMALQVNKKVGCTSTIIGNFIDEKRIEKYRLNKKPNDKYRIIFTGSFSDRKKPLSLISAMEELNERGINFVLDMYGDGPLLNKCKQEVRNKRLSGKVNFHGFVKEPYKYIANADVLVLPSSSEGVPRSVLEALYLGVPCLLRDIDGNKELIESEINGDLFQHDEELSGKILKVIKQFRKGHFDSDKLIPNKFRQDVCSQAYLDLLLKYSSKSINKEYKSYFAYLQTRSILGKLYRNFWLYPFIVKNIKGRALDIGCGIGDMINFRSNTVGVDINTHAVDYCVKKGLDARVMTIDILPFDSNAFDSVIMDHLLEHIENPSFILNEINRVLRKGGVLIIGVPGIKGFACDNDHKIFYNELKLKSLLDDFGFVSNKISYAPFKFKWFDKKLKQYTLYGVFSKL
jgi:glycosyltransferase involved in cell wall biosynthesis/predicted SAM-dependent methyltransferase